ncbi:MAG TPA: hypothetical protein P5230_01840 [Candidatus Magasanikbacteria bacterium]|nr:hypothetical protein [Candidatus Magasanikbacteria bacterium]
MNERKEQDLRYIEDTNRWKNDLILSAEKLTDKTKLSVMGMDMLVDHKTVFTSKLQTSHRTVFEIMTDEEKEKIWEIIKDDIPCLFKLVETNRSDVFPEKAFNYTTLGEIFSKGTKGIVEKFIHSQFYREGLKQFLYSKKYRRLIKDKIGEKLYAEIVMKIYTETITQI